VFAVEVACAEPSSSSSLPLPSQPSPTRRFVVTSYDELWARHFAAEPHTRHWYEVIREGAPCHLYFDCEFVRCPENAAVDGPAATAALLDLVRARLSGIADVEAAIELDSSTDTKFSRHLIVRLAGAVFCDNSTVGQFVRALVSDAATNPSSPLFVISEQGTRRSIVDLAVYSRHRQFRIVGSCKFGKTAILQPTQSTRDLFPNDRELFFASLICNVPEGATLLGGGADAGDGDFHLPTTTISTTTTTTTQPPREQAGGSPWPLLDRFVEGLASVGDVRGWIRSTRLVEESHLLIFNIGGNRFCGRIGRPHKSNHVFFVAHLQGGVVWQKCLDPDCHDFKGPEIPIPSDILATINLLTSK
jgi:hypothetical protein